MAIRVGVSLRGCPTRGHPGRSARDPTQCSAFARDRPQTTAAGAQDRRSAGADRTAPRRLLPIHRPRPAAREAEGERAGDGCGTARGAGQVGRARAGRSPARRRSASGSRRPRRSRSSARTRSPRPRTRPRRSSGSWCWAASRRSRSACPSASRSRCCWRGRVQLPPGLHRVPDRRRLVLGLEGQLRPPRVARRGVGAAHRLHADGRRLDLVRRGADRLGRPRAWRPSRCSIGVGAIALLTLGNLRGLREAGNIFALPTYLFLGGGAD